MSRVHKWTNKAKGRMWTNIFVHIWPTKIANVSPGWESLTMTTSPAAPDRSRVAWVPSGAAPGSSAMLFPRDCDTLLLLLLLLLLEDEDDPLRFFGVGGLSGSTLDSGRLSKNNPLSIVRGGVGGEGGGVMSRGLMARRRTGEPKGCSEAGTASSADRIDARFLSLTGDSCTGGWVKIPLERLLLLPPL